jgi:phosphatidate cytidylyltransferase
VDSVLKERVVTACVLVLLLALILFVLPYGGFVLAITLLFVVAAWEWANIAGFEKAWQRFFYAGLFCLLFFLLAHLNLQKYTSWMVCLFSFSVSGWVLALFAVWHYPGNRFWESPYFLLVAGLWLLVPAWLGLQLLQPVVAGSGLIWLVIAVIATADIGAYFSGRRFGRRKLAIHVSPGKTWEGFWGGAAANVLFATVIGYFLDLDVVHFFGFVVAMALVAAISVLGDLFESMMKRERGIKDSSQLLPGHGGVLDRIDGWTAAVPLFTLIYLLCWR